MRYCRRFLAGIPHLGVGTHVFLTRPPLPLLPEGVRLACVRHAASVYPEPGSNSPFNVYANLFKEIYVFYIDDKLIKVIDWLVVLYVLTTLQLFRCILDALTFATPF